MERPLFLFNSSRTNIFLLGLNKEILYFALFFDIFDLKVSEKHIFFAKKCVLFCDGKPTLAAHIFKNKWGRPNFLFDCSRTNIFLLGSNKEMSFFALFFYVFDLKVCRKHFLHRNKFFNKKMVKICKISDPLNLMLSLTLKLMNCCTNAIRIKLREL